MTTSNQDAPQVTTGAERVRTVLHHVAQLLHERVHLRYGPSYQDCPSPVCVDVRAALAGEPEPGLVIDAVVHPDDLTILHVRTHHPEDYELVNHEDGTRWRGARDGMWKRA